MESIGLLAIEFAFHKRDWSGSPAPSIEALSPVGQGRGPAERIGLGEEVGAVGVRLTAEDR